MEERKDELEIREDVLYDGDLSFEEIKENPILQPIMEVYTIYKSMGQVVQRAVAEFKIVLEQIQERMNKNPTYSQTMIIAKLQELIMHSKNAIHAQDIQRINIKKAMNDMVGLVKKYYELKRKEIKSFEDIMNIPEENLEYKKPKEKESEEKIDFSEKTKEINEKSPKKKKQPSEYNKFIAQQTKSGKTFAEAVENWRKR